MCAKQKRYWKYWNTKHKTEHNRNGPYTPDNPYRTSITGGSGYGKTNVLLNLINNQPDIDKIYLYTKDPYEAKYQYLINRREKVGIDHLDDPKAFFEYSNYLSDVYKNITECNPNKENKISIVFNDRIADMASTKKLGSIVTELFIRRKKFNISLVFIAQSYSKVPKDARLYTTHLFFTKITNKRELQQIAINHSSDTKTEDFINIYRKCTAESYSF